MTGVAPSSCASKGPVGCLTRFGVESKWVFWAQRMGPTGGLVSRVLELDVLMRPSLSYC